MRRSLHVPVKRPRIQPLPDRLAPYGAPDLAFRLAPYGRLQAAPPGASSPRLDRANTARRWVLSRLDESTRRRQAVETEREELNALLGRVTPVPSGDGQSTVLTWGLAASSPSGVDPSGPGPSGAGDLLTAR